MKKILNAALEWKGGSPKEFEEILSDLAFSLGQGMPLRLGSKGTTEMFLNVLRKHHHLPLAVYKPDNFSWDVRAMFTKNKNEFRKIYPSLLEENVQFENERDIQPELPKIILAVPGLLTSQGITANFAKENNSGKTPDLKNEKAEIFEARP